MEWLTQRFELSRGGGTHNVRPMEGLRGFAVFLVFLVHYVTLIKPWTGGNSFVLSIANSIHTIGNSGVDLFFVLSGYLIYGTLITRPQQFGQFMMRRVQRIYPTFISVFVIYVMLSFVFPRENKIPTHVLAGTIYLIQNFLLLPGLFSIEPMITVAWSLSYEMFYYLAIPLVIVLLGLRNRAPKWRAIFFSTLAVVTTIYCAVYGGPVRLIMFVAGILLHEAVNANHISTPKNLLGLSVLAFGLLANLLPISGPSGAALKISILFVSFFILCLICFRNPDTWLPHAFTWTPARWLGNMSYSYYLMHGLALKAAFLILAVVLPIANYGFWLFCVLLPTMFVLTLLPAAILFLAVERPFSLASPYTKRSATGLANNCATNSTVKADAL